MRILLTGGSSFTGLWFGRELLDAKHEVVATFTRPSADAYQGVRGERVRLLLAAGARPEFAATFGESNFLRVLEREGPWDVLCHHAADVTDYRAMSFDVLRAAASNTHNLPQVLERLVNGGGKMMICTGTYFEPDEGSGSNPREAVSPYGLSKALSWQVCRYWCQARGLKIGKFVMPNPVGAFEEPRLTGQLIASWRRGEPAVIQTPDYVRDNVPVRPLAQAYVRFLQESAAQHELVRRMNPSGWVETVAAFAQRVGAATTSRLGIDCPLDIRVPASYEQPLVRHNVHNVLSGWSADEERRFWDELVNFHARRPV